MVTDRQRLLAATARRSCGQSARRRGPRHRRSLRRVLRAVCQGGWAARAAGRPPARLPGSRSPKSASPV